MDFEMSSKVEKDILVLTARGYVNQNAGEQLLKAAQTFFSDGGKHIVLDMAATKLVNSVGISHIIDLIDQTKAGGGRVVLASATPTIEKTLNIMGIFQICGKCESVEEALNLLQK